MKGRILLFSLLSIAIFGCLKVPISGRRQVNLLPESIIDNMAVTNYRQFLVQNKPAPATDKDAEMVKRIGQKISVAVTAYLKSIKQSKRVKNYKL